MKEPPEVYETQGGKTVILQSAVDLISKFRAVALRINAEGDMELLIVGEEDFLEWTPMTALELVRTGSVN